MADAETAARARIGIPYAYGEIIDGALHRICPKCGVAIREGADLNGEQVTHGYQDHWYAEHDDEDES